MIDKYELMRRYIGYAKDALKGNGQYASKYKFVDRRQKEKNKLLYILSGYKPYLWKDVFDRVNKFCPPDVDVCLVSSGRYVEELADYSKKYNWSYLSSERNNICCVTNILMRLYDNIDYIFKMDEDMYLTKGCFEALLDVYNTELDKKRYDIGVVGAFVPINSFCLYKFLKHENKYEDFIEKFGWFNDGCTWSDSLRNKQGINSYIWECTGDIDEYAQKNISEFPDFYEVNCRYMIGFVLFRRKLWEEMGGFKVSIGKGSGDEGDEGQLLSYCFLKSQVILCAKNCIVGHFSYGGNEDEVLEVMKKHPNWFSLTKEV